MARARPGRLPRRLAFMALLALPSSAAAEVERFDHYILALSWMPSFCALAGDARDDTRCEPGSGHGWLVHGLWPQDAAGGWPEYCSTPRRNPSRRETAAQAALYGAAAPAWHQWNKHGRCTGLSARDYFALTRAAFEALAIPPLFATIDDALALPPRVVEASFVAANPGLAEDMMITTCRDGMVVELRLCLTRALEPRPCDPQLLRRACRLDAARLPARRATPER